jgi:hypothetical protein
MKKAIIIVIILITAVLPAFTQSKESDMIDFYNLDKDTIQKYALKFEPTPITTGFAKKIADKDWPYKEKIDAIQKFRKQNPKMGGVEKAILIKFENDLWNKEKDRLLANKPQSIKMAIEILIDFLAEKKLVNKNLDLYKKVIDGKDFRKRLENYNIRDVYSSIRNLGGLEIEETTQVYDGVIIAIPIKDVYYTLSFINDKNEFYIHKFVYLDNNYKTNYTEYNGNDYPPYELLHYNDWGHHNQPEFIVYCEYTFDWKGSEKTKKRSYKFITSWEHYQWEDKEQSIYLAQETCEGFFSFNLDADSKIISKKLNSILTR